MCVLLAQYQGASSVDMGRGAIVIGLAAVIIGQVLLSKVFRSFALKLFTALVVAIFLAIPYWKSLYLPQTPHKGGAAHA